MAATEVNGPFGLSREARRPATSAQHNTSRSTSALPESDARHPLTNGGRRKAGASDGAKGACVPLQSLQILDSDEVGAAARDRRLARSIYRLARVNDDDLGAARWQADLCLAVDASAVRAMPLKRVLRRHCQLHTSRALVPDRHLELDMCPGPAAAHGANRYLRVARRKEVGTGARPHMAVHPRAERNDSGRIDRVQCGAYPCNDERKRDDYEQKGHTTATIGRAARLSRARVAATPRNAPTKACLRGPFKRRGRMPDLRCRPTHFADRLRRNRTHGCTARRTDRMDVLLVREEADPPTLDQLHGQSRVGAGLRPTRTESPVGRGSLGAPVVPAGRPPRMASNQEQLAPAGAIAFASRCGIVTGSCSTALAPADEALLRRCKFRF